MSISFNGYKTEVLTFENENAEISYPVTVNSASRSIKASAESNFIGVCVTERNDLAGVQTDGYVELHYSSTAPGTGMVYLVADGNGGVKVPSSSSNAMKAYKVLKVDTVNKTVGFIL